jgi:dGTPase
MRAALAEIKAFLMARMYRHHRVNRMTAKARRVVRDLFEAFRADPGCLPPEWQGGDVTSVCDYVAGMTDGYALDEHRRLFDVTTRA